MNKRIFTFWEPKETIPEYIQLCIQTWKKFLPNYEIIILDYSNLNNWLGENFYDKYLYKNFSLPIQADAIRAAVLEKHGGIWFDTDTILTSPEARNLLKSESEFTLFGEHIGLIIAKPSGYILKKWIGGIKKKILLHKRDNNLYNYIFNYKYKRKFKSWDYLGNSILKFYIKNKSTSVFKTYDEHNLKLTPECNFLEENNLKLSKKQNYIDFYFKNNYLDYALQGNCGIICLHNSWTPSEYKTMNSSKFLNCNNTLSNILLKVLND